VDAEGNFFRISAGTDPGLGTYGQQTLDLNLCEVCNAAFGTSYDRAGCSTTRGGATVAKRRRECRGGRPELHGEWRIEDAGAIPGVDLSYFRVDMSYSPNAAMAGHSMFDNVFVSPSAYRA
jgi:hypothetical protein